MADKIIFKNGAIFVETWDSDSQSYTTEPLGEDGIRWSYNDEVEFDKELTIEGFMNALEPHFEVIDEHFAAYNRGFKSRHYYEQMQKPGDDDSEEDITHIEFYWSYELQEYVNYRTGKKDSNLEVYASFHGKGKNDINYSFSMSPINNWKHYLFKLNTNIKCVKFNRDEKSGLADWTTVFETTKPFTLYEILQYFLFEITFYGYTETIEEVADKLSKISDGIVGGGMGFVIEDINKWEIDTLKKELKGAEESDDFESAIRIRDRIKFLEEKIKNKS